MTTYQSSEKIKLKILQISANDYRGGAERIAFDLFSGYSSFGHKSWLIVGKKSTNLGNIFEIPTLPRSIYSQKLDFTSKWLYSQKKNIPGIWRLCKLLSWMSHPRENWNRNKGYECFNYPGSKYLFDQLSDKPDLIQAHNLHGGYFDLRYLSKLSKEYPVFLTLHDEWMFTGHCYYSLDCNRWKHGCGLCPDLNIPAAIKRDGSAENWQQKRKIYSQSDLFISTPSKWLMEKVQNSILNPIEYRVINNGIDLDLYKPNHRQKARNKLDLPQNAFIILSIANWSYFKDFETIEKAMKNLSQNTICDDTQIVFIVLGDIGTKKLDIGRIQVINAGYIADRFLVAQYFQAADLFLHAAYADNFPTTILEAFACGTPVIATKVGGIPEQIEDGVNGFLVPMNDSNQMAVRILNIFENDELRLSLGDNAAKIASLKYDKKTMAENYLSWYQEIIDKQQIAT